MMAYAMAYNGMNFPCFPYSCSNTAFSQAKLIFSKCYFIKAYTELRLFLKENNTNNNLLIFEFVPQQCFVATCKYFQLTSWHQGLFQGAMNRIYSELVAFTTYYWLTSFKNNQTIVLEQYVQQSYIVKSKKMSSYFQWIILVFL